MFSYKYKFIVGDGDLGQQDFFASVIGGGKGGSGAARPCLPRAPSHPLATYAKGWGTSAPTLREVTFSFVKNCLVHLNH